MNGVAAAAGNLSLGMAALDAARMSGFIQVTSKADLVRLPGAKLGRVSNVLGRSRLGVLARGAVAGLAGLTLAAELLLRSPPLDEDSF